MIEKIIEHTTTRYRFVAAFEGEIEYPSLATEWGPESARDSLEKELRELVIDEEYALRVTHRDHKIAITILEEREVIRKIREITTDTTSGYPLRTSRVDFIETAPEPTSESEDSYW